MMIRRVLAAAFVLVGGGTLLLAVLGMFDGNGAFAPFAFLGLMLSWWGVRRLADPGRSRPGARRSRGGYAVAGDQTYAAPTGDVGWYGPAGTDHDDSRRGSSGGHSDGGHHGGGHSDGGHHGGGDSGSSSGGWSGGGWSGGGDSGGWSGGGDSGGSSY